MAPDEIAPTTRRIIVKTGARLAYAAPLVATSVAMSSFPNEALAASPMCAAEQTCSCVNNRCTGQVLCQIPDAGTDLQLCQSRVEQGIAICGCPHFVCTQRPEVGIICDNVSSDCLCGRHVQSGLLVCVSDEGGGGLCDGQTGAGCPAGTICVVDGFFEGKAHCHSRCGDPIVTIPGASQAGHG
jgi:hypothetical protein